jgi:hypothetical protein
MLNPFGSITKPKFKSSNHKQIEKNQENKPQHKNLSKKRGSSDLKKLLITLLCTYILSNI